MPNIENTTPGADFLKSLGFPTLDVHESFTHFDFTTPGRRVLVIGPMGSGKTEFSARVWRDAAVARKKSEKVRAMTSTGVLDRRKIFFIRSGIDSGRFSDYPEDALPYRSGYIRCGENIARINDIQIGFLIRSYLKYKFISFAPIYTRLNVARITAYFMF